MKAITIFLLACAVAQAQTPFNTLSRLSPAKDRDTRLSELSGNDLGSAVVSVERYRGYQRRRPMDGAVNSRSNSSPTAINISGTIPDLKNYHIVLPLTRDGQGHLQNQTDYRSYANQYGTVGTSMKALRPTLYSLLKFQKRSYSYRSAVRPRGSSRL